MGLNNMDKEIESLTKDLINIVKDLKDPENKKDNKSQNDKSKSDNTSSNGSEENNNNQSSQSQSSQTNARDELKDALDELNNLLNQKDPKPSSDNKGKDSNGKGKDKQSGGQSSDGKQGQDKGTSSGESSNGDPSNPRSGLGSNSGSSQSNINFRGIQLDPRLLKPDIKTAKNDENKTERELNHDIDEMIKRAVQEAKQLGKGSNSSIINMWEETQKPKPPRWVDILSPYLRPDNNIQWTWTKAHQNRMTRANGGKVLFRGFNRPKEKLKDLCIALDNSGSIGQIEFNHFYGTVKGFLSTRMNVKGWVAWWNTKVTSSGEFKDYPSFTAVENRGSGGTDPTCALEFAKEKGCKYILIFTDGEFDFPDNKWEKEFTKILWVMSSKEEYERFNPKFGIKCLN